MEQYNKELEAVSSCDSDTYMQRSKRRMLLSVRVGRIDTDLPHLLSLFSSPLHRLLLRPFRTRTTPTSRSVVSKRLRVPYALVFLLPLNVYNPVADGKPSACLFSSRRPGSPPLHAFEVAYNQ